jgi:hypothetical protein
MTTRRLPVKLTDAEWSDRSARLARCVEDRKGLVDQRRTAMSEIRDRLIENEVSIEELSTVVDTRIEVRDVSITERKNFKTRKMETVRADTGEVIETRALKPDEFQAELPIKGAPTQKVAARR